LTIKLLLGLPFRPRTGPRLWEGSDRGHEERTIGYLPEESYLYRFLNAEETLDFTGCSTCPPRSVSSGRTRLIEMVGLNWAAAGGKEYSRGLTGTVWPRAQLTTPS
jgi:ABC-2 type transport system ATP-binding protein